MHMRDERVLSENHIQSNEEKGLLRALRRLIQSQLDMKKGK